MINAPSRVALVLLALATLTAAGLGLVDLGGPSLWDDEITTIRYAEHKPGAIIGVSAFIDVNPPLYYVAHHYWQQLTGGGEYAWRALSALLGLLAIPLIYTAGRGLVGQWPALIAAWYVALSPQHVYSSQEARSQTALMLLALLAAWALSRWEERGRVRLAALASIPTALALWTHYYALFFVAAWIVYSIRRAIKREWDGRRLTGSLVYLACTGLLSAPVGLILLIQLQGGQGWRPAQSILHVLVGWGLSQSTGFLPWNVSVLLGDRIASEAGHALPAMILALVISSPVLLTAAYGVKKLFKDGMPHQAEFLAWWFLAPPAMAALAALKTPLFDGRHSLVCLPATALLFGLGACHILTKRGLIGRAGVAVLAWAGLAIAASQVNLRTDAACARQDWRGLADEVVAKSKPGDVVFAHMEHAALSFDYYDAGRVPLVTAFEWFPRPEAMQEYPLAMSSEQREERVRQVVAGIASRQRVWFIDYHGEAFDPSGLAEKILAERHVPIWSRHEMSGAYRFGAVLWSSRPEDVAAALKPEVVFARFDGPALQLESGWLEQNEWTWAASRACVLLPSNAAPATISAEVYVPYDLLGDAPVSISLFSGDQRNTVIVDGPEALTIDLQMPPNALEDLLIRACLASDRSFVPQRDASGAAKSLLVRRIGWADGLTE